MKLFKRIYVEITNVCNLSCSFCPKRVRPSRHMDKIEFEKVLMQITPYTDYIYFHIKGEPLLHPQLPDILSLSREYNLKVNLTTNGTLLSNRIEILAQSAALRQLNISLHSFESSDSDQQRQYLNQVMSCVKELQEKTAVIISLRLWNFDKSNSGICMSENNFLTLKEIEKNFTINYSIFDKLISLSTQNRGIQLSERVYLNQDYQFSWPDLSAPFIGINGYCYGLKNQMGILSDGTVIPCCLDSEGIINLGNIFNTPLSNILSSDRATQLTNNFACRKISEPLCRHCGYRTRFKS